MGARVGGAWTVPWLPCWRPARLSGPAAAGQTQDVLLGSAAELAGNAAAPQHQDPVGQTEQLGEVGGDDDDPEPLAGQVADHLVELALGADIDALGRLVEDQHLGLGEQPAGEQHLLLVAARQGRDRLLVGARPEPKAVEERVGLIGLLLPGSSPRRDPLRRLAIVTFSRMESCGSIPRTLRSSVSSPMPAFIMLRGPVGLTFLPSTSISPRRSARLRISTEAARCGPIRAARRSPGSLRRELEIDHGRPSPSGGR